MERRAKRYNELWVTEEQTSNMKLSLRINQILINKKSEYQDILLVETFEYGRMLILDGAIQIAERDEFCYSEMMAHIVLCAHPSPKRVLIVGGGDGGVLREVLRHKEVEKATLIDIDKEVINASKKYLPTISCAMDDPRADVQSMDALAYISSVSNEFDVAIIDSTDPVDFAAGLFEADFYSDVKRALKEDGMMLAQTESPFSDSNVVVGAFQEIKKVYPITSLCWGAMPTYPTGIWTYTIGSKKLDPSVPRCPAPEGTKYYTTEIHKAAFVLPPFLKKLLDKA
ncbi:MAG: polyamine aminopropyltransferase [Aminobacterium colombiense]|uniref:Polyamine aminopropyltransferase n=1 Tax=Aminobacterium colombiense (strain DSM 12261 / ALA-1) TaxID=572547 RepID=D5ED52_AMICL|nr:MULTISPECIES: polyamine aminopropyltransferase [Aminobacterium]MDD2378776.1 polyamine aminopropyltransferase [Aminobacterium colombiense]ADE56484.1 spermidine synthase [Aminobacterium colombiense DSM 12261]MDD4265155.1 polyamine aminopropyltransferase [Aminobacterium colombiense]MDD4585361.1 polyamine aminopropyltransferase [Aminobacterium colombiense]NLK29437.1 polyamine aminopropyltransferase [Aminobacterium colombiense]